MNAPDLEAARRDTHLAHERYSAAVGFDGGPASDETQVAVALHAAFPNLRFAASDIEADDAVSGVWLIPVPRTVALIVDHGSHFDWSDVLWLRADAVSFDVGVTIESSL